MSLLLLFSGSMGAYLLIDPVGLAEKVSRRGIHIPILAYAETKLGRIRLRAMGLVFILATLLFLFGILSVTLGSKEQRGALDNAQAAGHPSQWIVWNAQMIRLFPSVLVVVGILTAIFPERAARYSDRRRRGLDGLAPEHMRVYLVCYRAFGLIMASAGVILALRS